MMTELRIEDVPEDLRDFYAELKHCALRDGASFYAKRCLEYIERIARLEARNAELEALASKWATDAPLSERRTLHEASLAYRKAAGVFPNPDGVKAILEDKS